MNEIVTEFYWQEINSCLKWISESPVLDTVLGTIH